MVGVIRDLLIEIGTKRKKIKNHFEKNIIKYNFAPHKNLQI